MKRIYETLPGALLLSYAVYSAFVPVSIAHSIIFTSLAGLFGYSLYVHSQQLPSTKQELLNRIVELEQKTSEQKEYDELRLKKLEDVVGGLAIAGTRPSSPSLQKNDKKIIF